MKIYTKIVFDGAGNVLEEESFEYTGPVAQAKGGGDNEVPETEEERALAQVSAQEWNHYVTEFSPLMDKYISDMRATDADYMDAGGTASMATSRAFSDAGENLTKATTARGINPNSGSFAGAHSGLAADRATTGAAAVSDAKTATRDRQDHGLMSAVLMGRGEAAQAVGGMGDIARGSVRDATNSANNAFQTRSSNQYAVGAIGGAAARGYGLGGKSADQVSWEKNAHEGPQPGGWSGNY